MAFKIFVVLFIILFTVRLAVISDIDTSQQEAIGHLIDGFQSLHELVKEKHK